MGIQPYLQIVEECIDEISRDFRKSSFNFFNERDLQARLFGYLRANKQMRGLSSDGEVELVHMEFPVFPVYWRKPKGKGERRYDRKYDLVLWDPQKVEFYIKHLGESPS